MPSAPCWPGTTARPPGPSWPTGWPTGRPGPAACRGGPIRLRITRLAGLDGWTPSVTALCPADGPDEVPERLAEVITAATLRYLRYGHGSPVLLVHTATAPNAVLHTIPALPPGLWAPSLTAVWAATAAIFSSYAPA